VVVSIIVFDVPTNVTAFAYRISRLSTVCSKDISIMKGGFFKLVETRRTGQVLRTWNSSFLQSGLHFGGNGTSEVQVLRTWDGGPNRVHWIFGHCGKIPESLAIVQPPLFLFGGGMGEIDGHVLIRLVEKGVPLGAEFLEGLGVDQLLELGLELLLWGFFVAFGKYNGFVCRPPLQWETESVV
jgi:hypothetical protein